jgi:hypothetical protein
LQGSPLPHDHVTPFSFHLLPRQPRRRSPAADACHLAMDRPPQAPSGQIGPNTKIPYPRPCLATSPSSRNRDPGGVPQRGLTGGRALIGSPPPPPVTPERRQPRPPSGTWAHAHGAVLALFPRWRAKWATCPRARARLGRIPPPPPAQLAEEIPFLFLFLFLYICIYIY